MSCFAGEGFNIFKDSFDEIYEKYHDIISMMGDVTTYVNTKRDEPYELAVCSKTIIDYVNGNVLDIAGEVKRIFNNTNRLNTYTKQFIDYYEFLNKCQDVNVSSSDEDKTKMIACVLICIMKNGNGDGKNDVYKKIYCILRSMCVYPTVRSLTMLSKEAISEI